MKTIQITWCLIIIFSACFTQEILPLNKRYYHTEDLGYDYSRGTYLIILAEASLESILRDEYTGDFIHFKQTQGFDIDIITFDEVGGTPSHLRNYLKYYYENIDSMLEYVLLIGDINGSYAIPSFTIPSYNESELDVTDYPYTFFENQDVLNPKYFIGRWSIRSQDDLKKIKMRSMQYVKLEYISDHSFLNRSLLVAGNYADSGIWPVTPVWTSEWLMDELIQFGYETVDTAFFHLNNQQFDNPTIRSSWNNGVGIINYRGWGDANGWHKPYFHREEVDPGLQNGWYLPVVLSFVCNTGDFGNDYSGSGLDKCFGEVLTTGGSINNPKGAAAMIGPSDLDTDTRFNNVLCAVMWDELLEGRIPELAPALHSGKQALIREFGGLEVNGTNIVEFYHHVYGVLGDPSLPVWLAEPRNMSSGLAENDQLNSSFISTIIRDEEGDPLMDVVGALVYNDTLLAKGLSNQNGQLIIDFDNVQDSSNIELYLNKAQFYQKKINLYFTIDDDESPPLIQYQLESNDSSFIYNFTTSIGESNWIEISNIGQDLELTDDSFIKNIPIDFDFQYYGQSFDSLTVCSNGWASFLPCFGNDENLGSCMTLPYFFNNSIPHPLGPYGMIAPFFDDLDDNNGNELFEVYFWTNSNDSAIVQWNNIANGQTDENCPDCVKETFQLILDNKNISQNSNGAITFQYKEIYDLDDHGSTVGIESPDKNHGVQYLFNYSYHINADTLKNGLAIKFTDSCGEIVPANWCDCEGNKLDCLGLCGGTNTFDYCGICGGDGSTCSMSSSNSLLPEGYTMNSFPNPFNPVVIVNFSAPDMGHAMVNVFDIRGRKLKTLTNQFYQPGFYFLNWDASSHASGVYFINLTTENISLTQKVLLLK